MGSFAHFSFAGVYHFDTKNHVDPEVMTIFREQDKKITVNGIDESVSCKYSISVSVIRQRLDVMGFSIKNAEKDFKRFVSQKVAELQENHIGNDGDWIDYESDGSDCPIDEFTCAEKIHVLTHFSFDEWFHALQALVQCDYEENEELSKTNEMNRYMLRFKLGPLDFPGTDLRYTLRLMAETVPDQAMVQYDYSNLRGGYYTETDNLVDLSLKDLSKGYEVVSKIIVLTEGSTDTRAIQASLELLYPYLLDYYYFMDFKALNAGGGAKSLVQAVRSFVGSGIQNRTIAIFDNDTAGKAEKSTLAMTNIPTNIKVTMYPDLDLAKHYPAVGPEGINSKDINGLACSLEMYFGSDVLRRNGDYVPVQEKTYYDKGIKQYQWGFSKGNKQVLQTAFFKKLDDCRKNPSKISQTDWEPMKLLLQSIFRTFSE